MPNKILVVDDEPDLEILLKQKFRKKIHDKELEFVFAENGVEALEVLNGDGEKEIDVVLTDINMPKMDGLTLLENIRNLNRLLSTVIISAYGDMKNIRSAMNLGAFDFLVKPIDLKDLEITLDKTIRMSKQLKKVKTYEEEIQAASVIQRSILPQTCPKISGLNIAAKYIPMDKVGGDFFDFIVTDDNKLGVIVADVAGHGVPAALVSSMVKIAFSFQTGFADNPVDVLTNINKILYGKIQNSFLTACYAYIDLEAKRMVTAKAAHPPSILFRPSEKKITHINPSGRIIGWFEIIDCGFEVTEIQSGDRIIIYTDGVTEAFNLSEKIFGEKRLEEIILNSADLSPSDFIKALVDSLCAWSATDSNNNRVSNTPKQCFEDDATVVVIDVL
jgi:sigma-B regulation protein RsbU (phosphoserine phosphatase)